LKIINLIENLDDRYGGPAKSVPYMCKYLNDIDVNTEILSVKYHEDEQNSIVSQYKLKWKSFTYNFIKKIRYSLSLKQYLNESLIKNKDIVLHTHNLWNYIPFIANKMGNKHNIGVVYAIRGSLYPWSLSQGKIQKTLAWKLFQKQALQSASCIHVTEINELNAVRDLGITSPVAIVPNGIEFDEFKTLQNKESSKKSLGLAIDKKYTLFMSRLHPKKGVEFLVKAWIKIAKQNKEWDLLIVGPEYDKRYVDNLKKEISLNNLEQRVKFIGMLTDQKRIDAFGASDLFVLPSHTENFGIAIAEAMVAKLPVITTHGTPWQEIEEYEAGWWLELNPNNIDNVLAEALACSEDELKQKGLNGFELIQKYEWRYQADKMKQVYQWILGKTKKPKFIYEFGDEVK
jgi:glycosyltransferase involved in cell wall biosynthesis